MNKRTLKHVIGTVLLLCIVLQACSPAVVNEPAGTQIPITGAGQPTVGQSVASSGAGSASATETSQPAPVPAEIQHYNWPGSPSYYASQLGNDCTMGYSYTAGQTVQLMRACDAWSINFLERPMAAGSMNYLPFLDIETVQMGTDSAWYYGRIRVFEAGLPTDGSSLYYLFELDTDFDGRGEYLISVENLPLDALEWTVIGVRVWQDTNGDVGSATAIRSDGASTGDGYDTLVFDQGIGADPDLAWARRSPDAIKAIEFSFKPALINNEYAFTWWAWSFLGELDPAQFDVVDASPGAYQMDNTCTMGFNGDSSGFPNACYTLQPASTPVPDQGCVKPPKPDPDSCWIWEADKCTWTCFN